MTLNDQTIINEILTHKVSAIYLLLCLPSDGLHCDWIRLMKEVGQFYLQEVVGEVQTHLYLVGGVYPSFCLARSGKEKTQMLAAFTFEV